MNEFDTSAGASRAPELFNIELKGSERFALEGLLLSVGLSGRCLYRCGDMAVAQTNLPPTSQGSNAGIGLAMVFVLLNYGGWNEVTYISAEMKGRRDVARALLVGIGVTSGLYLLVRLARVCSVRCDHSHGRTGRSTTSWLISWPWEAK
jgi:hypothetical protein